MPTSPIASVYLLGGLVFAIASAPLWWVACFVIVAVVLETAVFFASGRGDEDGLGA